MCVPVCVCLCDVRWDERVVRKVSESVCSQCARMKRKTFKTDVLAIFHFRRKNFSPPFLPFEPRVAVESFIPPPPSREIRPDFGFDINIWADYLFWISRRFSHWQYAEGISFSLSPTKYPDDNPLLTLRVKFPLWDFYTNILERRYDVWKE